MQIFVEGKRIFQIIDNKILIKVHFMALTNEEIMLKERIRFLLHQMKCPIARMSDNPTLQSRYSRQINGVAQVPFTTIALILDMFPKVSAEWLIRGEGTMTRSGEGAPRFYTTNNVHDNHNGGDINIGPEATIDKRITDLQRQLEEITKDRDLLKGLLAAMTTQHQNKK